MSQWIRVGYNLYDPVTSVLVGTVGLDGVEHLGGDGTPPAFESLTDATTADIPATNGPLQEALAAKATLQTGPISASTSESPSASAVIAAIAAGGGGGSDATELVAYSNPPPLDGNKYSDDHTLTSNEVIAAPTAFVEGGSYYVNFIPAGYTPDVTAYKVRGDTFVDTHVMQGLFGYQRGPQLIWADQGVAPIAPTVTTAPIITSAVSGVVLAYTPAVVAGTPTPTLNTRVLTVNGVTKTLPYTPVDADVGLAAVLTENWINSGGNVTTSSASFTVQTLGTPSYNSLTVGSDTIGFNAVAQTGANYVNPAFYQLAVKRHSDPDSDYEFGDFVAYAGTDTPMAIPSGSIPAPDPSTEYDIGIHACHPDHSYATDFLLFQATTTAGVTPSITVTSETIGANPVNLTATGTAGWMYSVAPGTPYDWNTLGAAFSINTSSGVTAGPQGDLGVDYTDGTQHNPGTGSAGGAYYSPPTAGDSTPYYTEIVIPMTSGVEQTMDFYFEGDNNLSTVTWVLDDASATHAPTALPDSSLSMWTVTVTPGSNTNFRARLTSANTSGGYGHQNFYAVAVRNGAV